MLRILKKFAKMDMRNALTFHAINLEDPCMDSEDSQAVENHIKMSFAHMLSVMTIDLNLHWGIHMP